MSEHILPISTTFPPAGHMTPVEGLRFLYEHGFDSMDFNFVAALDSYGRNWQDMIEEVKRTADEIGMLIVSGHLPFRGKTEAELDEKIKAWYIYCTVSFEDRRPIISTKLIETYKRHAYIPHQGWNNVNDPIISYDGVLYPTYELYFSENTSKEKLEKGEYIIAVQCWIINSDGNILLTQRKLNKKHLLYTI